MVADREADFAIVIGQCRHDRIGRCHQGRDDPRRPYMEVSWVMMPGEQNSLEQDRECADERAPSGPPLSSASEPNPHGEAHPHLDLCAPPLYAERSESERVRATIRYSITLWRNCEPLSRDEIWSYPKRTGWEKVR